jgi:hypothetical protein
MPRFVHQRSSYPQPNPAVPGDQKGVIGYLFLIKGRMSEKKLSLNAWFIRERVQYCSATPEREWDKGRDTS